MRRLFSGSKSPDLPSPPNFFKKSTDSTESNMKRSWSASNLGRFTKDSLAEHELSLPQTSSTLSLELIPIVTLLSTHAHRRYHEGVFLILHDLKSDGTQAARTWKEVYGVLIGTQLALWDAKELAESNGGSAMQLKSVAAKPTYINFTDAILKPLNPMDSVVTESKQKLDNALVVSTTLKNRYFLQFSNKDSFTYWSAAIRLSLFECTSLQEAYTGAFLSSRGSKLGDIKVILAETKFDYEDWVSVRFGAGMPWKRCYAVISQSTSKKNPKGKICFYESDKKIKKTNAMATVVNSKAAYAVYPSSNQLIDTSTIIKLEGSITFNKKEDTQDVDIFIMPEKHQAVPGYDTIIRFLVPSMNAFKLYGRPKKLIASKDNTESLLFGLPTLPHVHYLSVEELIPIANSSSSLQWNVYDWRSNIKGLLQKKISQGYSGCGSSKGLASTIASPMIGASELFGSSSPMPNSETFFPSANSSRNVSRNIDVSSTPSTSEFNNADLKYNGSKDSFSDRQSQQDNFSDAKEKQLPLSSSNVYANNFAIQSKSQEDLLMQKRRSPMKVDIEDSNYRRVSELETSKSTSTVSHMQSSSVASDLVDLYDKYSTAPFGRSQVDTVETVPQSLTVDDEVARNGAYDQYMGSSETKTFEISNIRDSNSTVNSLGKNANFSTRNGPSYPIEDDTNTHNVDEIHELSKRISQMGMGSMYSISISGSKNNLNERKEKVSIVNDEDNIFDPDFDEQNNIYVSESNNYSNTNFSYADQARNVANTNMYKKSSESLGSDRYNNFTDQNDIQPLQQPQYTSNITVSGNDNLQSIGNYGNMNKAPQEPYGQPYQSVNSPNNQKFRNIPNMEQGQIQQQYQGQIQPQQQGIPNQYHKQNRRMGPSPVTNNFRPPQPQGAYPPNVQQGPYQQQHPYVQSGYPQQQQQQHVQSGYPQQRPIQQSSPYQNVYNRPHHQMNPINKGSPTSAQYMGPNGIRSSQNNQQQPLAPINNGKGRPQPAGGFSQYMPSTANSNNPYSR